MVFHFELNFVVMKMDDGSGMMEVLLVIINSHKSFHLIIKLKRHAIKLPASNFQLPAFKRKY